MNASLRNMLLEFGIPVDRTAAAMAATPETLFTVSGGPCLLGIVWGAVTTVIQAQATTLKLQNDPTGAVAAADLCAATDINADAVGTLLLPTGLQTDVMFEVTAGGLNLRPMIVQPGIITAVYGAVSTGAIEWHLRYVPLTAAGRIVAS